MTVLLLKILRILFSKTFALALGIGVAVAGFALYLYMSENIRIERERIEKLNALQIEAQDVYSELETIHEGLIQLGERLDVARNRLSAANETIEILEGLMIKLEYLFMSAEEKSAHNVRLAEARSVKGAQELLLGKLLGEDSELRISRAGLAERSKALGEQIGNLESTRSELARYLMASWDEIRPYLIYVILALIIVPFAYKLLFFFVVGPLLSSSRPIRFDDGSRPVPTMSISDVSAVVTLEVGYRAWIKETYLQASDEGVNRKTRFVLDWKIPFTCVAAGLIELIEFDAPEGGGHPSITVSTQDRPDMELGVATLEEGASLVLRPSHIAGLVSRNGEPVRIARHWRIGYMQSWIKLQFRYFEICGPCQVIIAGVRGVRVEEMEAANVAGRRANQDATIGFTPGLDYGAARAETFWSYLRGMNPLFDDVFKGDGLFLCQEISSQGYGSEGRRFWKGLWEAMLKTIGV